MTSQLSIKLSFCTEYVSRPGDFGSLNLSHNGSGESSGCIGIAPDTRSETKTFLPKAPGLGDRPIIATRMSVSTHIAENGLEWLTSLAHRRAAACQNDTGLDPGDASLSQPLSREMDCGRRRSLRRWCRATGRLWALQCRVACCIADLGSRQLRISRHLAPHDGAPREHF
jgi:hypothetical protein